MILRGQCSCYVLGVFSSRENGGKFKSRVPLHTLVLTNVTGLWIPIWKVGRFSNCAVNCWLALGFCYPGPYLILV
ncbi:hypothetical protein MRB53_008200 [Persea americana]|uniref:Uncharacterized protein n=1 Tax=Persea americana TaxID=3435 RepID=A0ACC2ML18_PERAE|nr:hypothetical protein MRB53_008200 [Persea americana]